MFFPTLNEIKTQRKTVSVFGGYNHNLRIRDNEFYDMKNMSADNYPLISTRGRRTVDRGFFGVDALMVGSYDIRLLKRNDGGYGLSLADHFWYEQVVLTKDTNLKRWLAKFGPYVIVMPDGYYLNTESYYNDNGREDFSEKGLIENKYNSSSYQDTGPTFTLCESDGTEITVSKSGKTPPATPAGGDYWIDTSSGLENVVLKVWSENLSSWMPVSTTYVKISASGIGSGFKAGDGVNIENIKYKTLKLTTGSSSVLVAVPDSNSIVIRGLVSNSPQSQTSYISVERRMPNMDYVVECNNRLWGCRFGYEEDSLLNVKTINEIYACKLGDITNWNCFDGVSTDSYAASCGSHGSFTGAATVNGCPVFFKEDCVHKVYGNYPSNFQVQMQKCDGVQRGCHNSVAEVNGSVFYKGVRGIMAYDGSTPYLVTDAIGDGYRAVAGYVGTKYYISMNSKSFGAGEQTMFCYDTKYGLLHKLDNTYAVKFAYGEYLDGNETVDEYGNYQLVSLKELNVAEEPEKIDWMLESGIIGLETDNNKYIGRMLIKAAIDEGAYADVFVQYDSNGKWERVTRVKAKNLRTFNIPIRPRRCDHFRIKLEGEGDVKIFSITKVIEEGSDTYAI